ncbi:T9SS type A sorting domain-containing protein [Aquirufa ecclesiirivi]|uniref:T9SS type A sorting domain-containing protein n=1 Tax=Aquirufa ecclesiirivi TaxID=2715124 RepID=UPI0023D7FFDB|nr:T9SS type A sorting domain-containing protein [Aquirufa ecclesiirivi]MDF0694805.1 T9SS type A sorting domain-containing protein [Aquirufa ecclesiirivi]
MNRFLPVLISCVLFLLFVESSWNVSAQGESKSRSRLEMKSKPYPVRLPILLAKRSFKINPQLQTNLNIQENTYISQFLKNTYAQASTTKSAEPMGMDRKVYEETGTNDNYLFQSDRLVVSNLYPNPANDYADIDFQMLTSNQEVKIVMYNILGQEIKELILDKDQRNARISLRDFNSGMYMYQLMIDGRSIVTKKLIVRKQ